MICRKPEILQYEMLSQYLNEIGFSHQFDYIPTNNIQLAEQVESAFDKYDSLRFEPSFYEEVAGLYHSNSSEVMTLAAADCLVKRDKRWWAISILFPALQKVLSSYGHRLDLQSEVLIVGTDGLARLCIAAFVKLGFKKINVTSVFDERGRELVHSLSRFNFDVHFSFYPTDQLILLPGIHGVIVNTEEPGPSNSEVLKELSYFNFLKSNGLVWDINLLSKTSPLIREASGVGAMALTAAIPISWADFLWIKSVTNKSIDQKKYLEFLIKNTQQVDSYNDKKTKLYSV